MEPVSDSVWGSTKKKKIFTPLSTQKKKKKLPPTENNVWLSVGRVNKCLGSMHVFLPVKNKMKKRKRNQKKKRGEENISIEFLFRDS